MMKKKFFVSGSEKRFLTQGWKEKKRVKKKIIVGHQKLMVWVGCERIKKYNR